jgi:uncharacterized protein YkwD
VLLGAVLAGASACDPAVLLEAESTPSEIPDNDYCLAVADWDPAFAAFEDEVLVLVNEHRSRGASCDREGTFAATHDLVMDGALRCAARVHARDMGVRGYLDHTSPEGEDLADRLTEAGYDAEESDENIAAGSGSPESVVMLWMSRAPHCANIMSPEFENVGVGYHPGGHWGHVWTQIFARP